MSKQQHYQVLKIGGSNMIAPSRLDLNHLSKLIGMEVKKVKTIKTMSTIKCVVVCTSSGMIRFEGVHRDFRGKNHRLSEFVKTVYANFAIPNLFMQDEQPKEADLEQLKHFLLKQHTVPQPTEKKASQSSRLTFKSERDKELSRQQEIKLLEDHLNFYLREFNLHEIERYSDKGELFTLATIGDCHLASAFKMSNLPLNYSILLSNESQANALAHLGYPEFLNCSRHVGGTFFEALYAVAILQSNTYVKELLERSIFNQELKGSRLSITFKK